MMNKLEKPLIFCSVCSKQTKNRKFCSYECAGKSKRTRPLNNPRPCIICGKVWKPTRSNGAARFCSGRCQMIGQNGVYRILSKEAQAKANETKRNKGSQKGYRKFNGIHEHRLIAEEKLGRKLLPGEIVHHIDGNKRNNDPDNLEVMTQSEHCAIHQIGQSMSLETRYKLSIAHKGRKFSESHRANLSKAAKERYQKNAVKSGSANSI